MNPIPTGPQTETTNGTINPSGVYRSPDGSKTLVAQASNKMGNPVADALMQLGWTFERPIKDGDVVRVELSSRLEEEEMQRLRARNAELEAEANASQSDAKVTVPTPPATPATDDSVAVAAEIAAENKKTTTTKK